MSKRFTESEVLAMTRNKKEEKALKLRLQRLADQKGEYHDNSLKEMKQMVEFCKNNRRTSGYSPLPQEERINGDVTIPSLQEMRRFTKPWATTPQTTTFNVNFQNTSPVPALSEKRSKTRSSRSGTTLSRMSTRNSSRLRSALEHEKTSDELMKLSRSNTEDKIERKHSNSDKLDQFLYGEKAMLNNRCAGLQIESNHATKEDLIITPEMKEEQTRKEDYEQTISMTKLNDLGENNKVFQIIANRSTSSEASSDTKALKSVDDMSERGSVECTEDGDSDKSRKIDHIPQDRPNNVAKVKFDVRKEQTDHKPGHDEEKDEIPESVDDSVRPDRSKILNAEDPSDLVDSRIIENFRVSNRIPPKIYNMNQNSKINTQLKSSYREHEKRDSGRERTYGIWRESESERIHERGSSDLEMKSGVISEERRENDKGSEMNTSTNKEQHLRPVTSFGEKTSDQAMHISHGPTIPAPEVSFTHARPHTVAGAEFSYADRELEFSSDSEDGEYIMFRGKKIRNYVKPQHRYKSDPFQFRRREKLFRKLATEAEVFVEDQRKKLYKVEITFSKATRQRLLKQLVDENSSRDSRSKIDTKDDKLDFKIKSFLQSIDSFCSGNSQ